MEHNSFEYSGLVDPSTTSPGACIALSPMMEVALSTSAMATRRRRNRVATKAFYDNLTASAHDGQDEQVWALSDISDAAVGLSAFVPTSPSVSPAPPYQSSASVVVLQDDFSTVVAAAELTDARPGIAL